MTVFVYFFCDASSVPQREELYALPRSIPRTKAAVLRATLEQLLEGPTPEETARGFKGFLPDRELFIDATVTDDGVAIIDFARELAEVGNLSATSPAEGVRLTLEAAARQFPTVKEAVYRLEGDPVAWCRLFELSCDGPSTYGQWEGSDISAPPLPMSK